LTAMGGNGAIVLEDAHLRVELSSHDGSVQAIENRVRQLPLIRYPVGRSPWRIEIAGQAEWFAESGAFSWVRDGDRAVDLRWETTIGLIVEGRVELPADATNARFSVAVRNHSDELGQGLGIDKIEYPIFRGIGDLRDDVDTYLAHPQGTGFLFLRPYHLFEEEPIRRQGLRYSPYPEGFSGSSMQFMTYYADGIGGFDFATHDPTGAMKWFNFFKSADGTLECSFIHQSPDVAAGRDFEIAYPVLVGALVEGNWYEAAERYKGWATQQPWTERGTLAERTSPDNWLLEQVGFATFGINARHDRSGWLDRFHAITGQPVFQVLGVNWPKAGSDYRNNLPGGRDDWFPAEFDQTNLETIRRNGDYWAPFEFDLLQVSDKADGERVAQAQQVFPAEKYSFDRYEFPFVCPADPYLPEFHRWRDEELVRSADVDALYYDISVNNVLMACRSPDHGHPIGGGAWMVDAYRRMYAATRAGVNAVKGVDVPQGAEMISECFIPSFDFYQARAEASPLSGFEADFFRDWIKRGEVEKIPLFTYVYHEYGPVRLDGWGKLSREVGELFYWVASRVALWDGLFELNYEFSDLEALDGWTDDPAEHYYPYAALVYEVDDAKVAFVREIALARTGFAKDFLVYGTMLPPLRFAVPSLTLDYHLYNVGTDRPHYNESSSLTVHGVIHAAWRAPDGRLGFLFVNLHQDQAQPVTLDVDLAAYGLAAGHAFRARWITASGEETIGDCVGRCAFERSLEPRRVTLLEISPEDID
jgi:hypothetical protein